MKLLYAVLFSTFLTLAAAAQPCGLTLIVLSTTTAPCGECASTIQVDGSGGTQPYSYTWSTGDTTDFVSGLCPGSYTCTIVDVDSCVSFGTINVTSTSPPLVAAFVTLDASCEDTCCDGRAMVNVSGGTPPYTIAWSNGDVTDTATGLCAGKYVACVTDANGCTTCDTIEVQWTTGMEERWLDGMMLYPNPAQTALNIILPEGMWDAEVKIYDVAGRLVQRERIVRHAKTIGVDGLAPGVYLLEISSGGKTGTRKFLKE